jgi:hypothetical protein
MICQQKQQVHQIDVVQETQMIQEAMKKSQWDSKDKTASSQKKIREQKLLHVLSNKNDHKIWVNVKIILNKLL